MLPGGLRWFRADDFQPAFFSLFCLYFGEKLPCHYIVVPKLIVTFKYTFVFYIVMIEKYALIKAIQAVTASPSGSFSVRGLAREAGLSPGSTRASLDYMREKGIVLLKVVGNTYQYRANLENALCRQWKILFNLSKLADSKIIEEAIKKIPQVQSILLYGSFAKGTNSEKSDIDLLIVVHRSHKQDLGFANRLGREANILVVSVSDWKKKALHDRVFYENVIYDSIVLHGERPVVS